jgi:hypothetical protein
VSRAGTALLGQVADKLGLSKALSLSLAVLKQRRRGHDPGRVIQDLALALADGGECVSDLGAVRQGACGSRCGPERWLMLSGGSCGPAAALRCVSLDCERQRYAVVHDRFEGCAFLERQFEGYQFS